MTTLLIGLLIPLLGTMLGAAFVFFMKRDMPEEFDSLESLCYNFNTEPEKIKAILLEAGYVYSEEQEQFRPIGYDVH